MDRTNMRIVSANQLPLPRTVYGEWFVRPGDTRKLGYIQKQLAAIRAGEPHSGVLLQTRGTHADWHDFQPN